MPKWLRALIAAYGAKKLGGGCFSTILIFFVIYYLTGTCNRPQQPVQRTGEVTIPNKSFSTSAEEIRKSKDAKTVTTLFAPCW